MGRVSREQAERNRERVVEAACRMFRQYGVENVSIADVMAEVGMTPGGFYKQFASKEALIDEAFELAFKQASGSWAEVRKRHSGGAYRGLYALVRHYFKPRTKEQSCPMLAFSAQVSHQPADAHATDIYGNGVEKLFSQFREEALKKTGARGAQKPSEEDVMVLFAAMLGTGLVTRAVGRRPWVDRMQDAVLNALPKPEKDDLGIA